MFYLSNCLIYLEKAKNECGNELLTESRGTISSPNYSSFNNSTYPPNINCKWNKEGNHTLLTEVFLIFITTKILVQQLCNSKKY